MGYVLLKLNFKENRRGNQEWTIQRHNQECTIQRHNQECTIQRHNQECTIQNIQSRDTCNIGYTRHMTKTNKTKNTTQKTKKMSNTDTTKNQDRHHVLAKGKQFLPLIRHTPCYSYKTTVRLPQSLVTLADCRIFSISVARLFLFLKEFIIICVWFNTLSVIQNFPVVSVSYNAYMPACAFRKNILWEMFTKIIQNLYFKNIPVKFE